MSGNLAFDSRSVEKERERKVSWCTSKEISQPGCLFAGQLSMMESQPRATFGGAGCGREARSLMRFSGSDDYSAC